MKDRKYYKNIQKKLLFYGLIPSGALMIVCGILSGINGLEFASIFAGIFAFIGVGIGIAEALLGSKCKMLAENEKPRTNNNSSGNFKGNYYSGFGNNPNNSSTGPKTNNDSSGANPRYNYSSNSYKRVLSDKTIDGFDEYIARNFPQLPLVQFKGSLNGTKLEDIKAYTLLMQEHLKLSKFIINIDFEDVFERHEAGNFVRENYLYASIKIRANLTKSQMEATIAHEMSHAFESFNDKPLFHPGNIVISEQFTDILTFYLGFEKLVEAGYYTKINNCTTKLGYVEAGDFIQAKETYGKRVSSSDSFTKEKHDLEAYLDAYESYVNVICSLCEQLRCKYMPPDDKKFVNDCLAKYSSAKVKEYIRKTREETERKAYINIKFDAFRIEEKMEELLADYKKIQSFADFILFKQ